MRKFGIITNLRDKKDIPLVFPEYKKENLPSYKVWSEFNVFGAVKGYLLVLGLTGEEIVDVRHLESIRQQILSTVNHAEEEWGIELFGLTSLTSSVTRGGKWLVERKPEGISINHGDHYSVASAIEGIKSVVERMNWWGKSKKPTIGIVGAYGLIGRALSKMLVQEDASLILVGRRKKELQKLRSSLYRFSKEQDKVIISTNLYDLKGADVIITATSDPSALISPSCLKEDSPVIVYEVSVPPNIPKEKYERLKKARPNVVKMDGSLVKLPENIDLGVSISEIPADVIFACWAEIIMQSLEGEKEDHVGDIDISDVNKILNWGKKWGFPHAPFSRFGEYISEEFEGLKKQKV